MIVEIRKAGKAEPSSIALRLASALREGEKAPEVSVPLPNCSGWHRFDLRWKDGKLSLNVDDINAGTIPIQSLNIPCGTGPAILQMAKFVFGGRGPVEAVDDIRAWKTAP